MQRSCVLRLLASSKLLFGSPRVGPRGQPMADPSFLVGRLGSYAIQRAERLSAAIQRAERLSAAIQRAECLSAKP